MRINQPINRSPVPDLIFKDYRERRIKSLENYLYNEEDSIPDVWNRFTVFVTNRCNIRCYYCKTIPALSINKIPDLTFPEFENILEKLLVCPIKHIHFTGGEATLLPELPKMVNLANKFGILTSTTTNGLVNRFTYKSLVAAGLDEIRISLDSNVSDEYDKIVGKKGAYQKVIGNIKSLVQIRDERLEGTKPFLIINTCVTEINRLNLLDIIKSNIDLGVNDVKLLPMIQNKNSVWDLREKNRFTDEINKYLLQFSDKTYPLLRNKLETLFSDDIFGLKDITSQQLMQNCFIPLSERTINSKFYYPCSVYLREGGEPLGEIDEDLAIQRTKVKKFVLGTSCREDPICKESCLNCLKKFNQRANLKIHKTVIGKDGEEKPLNFELTYRGDITTKKIIKQIDQIQDKTVDHIFQIKSKLYLVIKPGGMKYSKKIYEIIKAEGFEIVEERKIKDWNKIALKLYHRIPTESAVSRGLVMAKVLPKLEYTKTAKLIIFKDNKKYNDLEKLKRKIRKVLKPKYCLIKYKDDLVITELNFVHA
jgi:MoaA/NifB/PqqE/SkfB family radical SAM enzyme